MSLLLALNSTLWITFKTSNKAHFWHVLLNCLPWSHATEVATHYTLVLEIQLWSVVPTSLSKTWSGRQLRHCTMQLSLNQQHVNRKCINYDSQTRTICVQDIILVLKHCKCITEYTVKLNIFTSKFYLFPSSGNLHLPCFGIILL